MNPFLFVAPFLVVVLAFVAWIASRPRGHKLTALGNVAEGFQPAKKTYLTDGALAARYLVVKKGSDSGHVAVCGVGDIPLGFATDEAPAAEEPVAVSHFGLQEEGALGVASGTVTDEDFLVPGAAGTVRKLPTASGTYYIIGRANLNGATVATGLPVQYIPCFPIQRVVP